EHLKNFNKSLKISVSLLFISLKNNYRNAV
ncbi:MAG: hypothetical protein ACI9OS_002584, partial [Ulvibacter sp.]